MSVMTLVLGKSGTGKSTAMRNLNQADTALIKVIEKPLPFKAKGWAQYTTDHWAKIIEGAHKAVSKGKSIIIVDDFQYLMANEFIRRSDERGYDKFSEIARHAWEVINALSSLPNHVCVYVTCHTDESEGVIKARTVGRMLDERINVEGMFTIVMRTAVMDGEYLFSTRNNGIDTVKTPMGLFDTDYIGNDLAVIDAAIRDYYDIQEQQQ